jgi:F-type H+-transporting ATPase subunit a
VTHFSWIQLLPSVTHENLHVATAIVTGLILIVLAVIGRLALGHGDKAVAPASGLSVKGVFELITEFIVDLAELVIGEEGKVYVPMFAAIFFYILFNNMMGLIPGIVPITDNLNTTMAIGLFSFLIYNYVGIQEHGIAYLKHFMGPVLWLAPLMTAIELVSHVIRPLTLGLRLQGNIMADHTVLAVFVDMFKGAWFIPVPAIFLGMGIFVSCMQAFVFTMLSMIYISRATAHDH